jgi:hypothetical protein
MALTGEYGNTRIKICPSVYLTNTNLRWCYLELNPNPLEGKPASTRPLPQEMLEIFSSLQVGLLQGLKGGRSQTIPSHQVSLSSTPQSWLKVSFENYDDLPIGRDPVRYIACGCGISPQTEEGWSLYILINRAEMISKIYHQKYESDFNSDPGRPNRKCSVMSWTDLLIATTRSNMRRSIVLAAIHPPMT